MRQADITQSTFQAADLVDGVQGKAAYFDGSSDYVQVFDSSSQLTSLARVSLSAWVKPDTGSISGGAVRRIISKWGGNPIYQSYMLSIGDGGVAKLRFEAETPLTTTWIDSTSTIPEGVWTHVLGTYDGSSLHLYINGVSAATPVALTGNLIGGMQYVRIGHESDGTGTAYFKGAIDEPYIIDHAA